MKIINNVIKYSKLHSYPIYQLEKYKLVNELVIFFLITNAKLRQFLRVTK